MATKAKTVIYTDLATARANPVEGKRLYHATILGCEGWYWSKSDMAHNCLSVFARSLGGTYELVDGRRHGGGLGALLFGDEDAAIARLKAMRLKRAAKQSTNGQSQEQHDGDQ